MPETPSLPEATAADVRRMCGEIQDWKAAAILALHPAAADVAAAVAWAEGEDELGRAGRPLEGLAAQIHDLLKLDEDYPDEP